MVARSQNGFLKESYFGQVIAECFKKINEVVVTVRMTIVTRSHDKMIKGIYE